MRKLTATTTALAILCAGAGWYNKPPDPAHVQAVLGEAENQGYQGMLAVACGINNRPEGLQGVWGARSDRHALTTDQYRKMASRAVQEAKTAKNCAFLGGADMWCSNMAECAPKWRSVPMQYVTKIKDHTFFRRLKRGDL